MVKNQHYIPQAYLKRFGKNKKIDVFDRLENKYILGVNVRNFASERYFYDIDPNELKDELLLYKEAGNISNDKFNELLKNPQLIEGFLSKAESRAINCFNKLEEDYSLINDQLLVSFIVNFVHLQSIRTKNYRKDLELIATQTSAWLKNLGIKKVSNYPLELSPSKIAQLEQLKQILSLPELYRKLTLFFSNYDAFLGVNNTDLGFILSEDPFLDFYLGFNDICVPVNPNLCIIFRVRNVEQQFLLCTKKPNSENLIFLDEKDITKYAFMQYKNSSKYLFGAYKDIKHLLSTLEMIKK